MSRNSAELKCTWTNGLIWAAIMSVAAVALRYVLWFFLIWKGDTSVFTDAFCGSSLPLLIASFALAVIMYLIMYRGYMKLAASHPEDLHGVAIDRYGKPALLPLILLAVLEVLWIVVCVVIVWISCQINIFVYENDMTVIITFVALHLVNLLVDLSLCLMGKRFFKPNLVQRSH